MLNRTTLIIVAGALTAALLGLLAGKTFFGTQRHGPPKSAVTAIGEKIPNLALIDLQNRVVDINQWQGKTRVINLWASWCQPCVHEMPVLENFAKENPDVQVIGVAFDDIAAVSKFLDAAPVSYPVAIATDPNRAASQLGNARSALPFSALIDAQGILKAAHLGDFDAQRLKDWVARHR